eukprot:g2017.t1
MKLKCFLLFLVLQTNRFVLSEKYVRRKATHYGPSNRPLRHKIDSSLENSSVLLEVGSRGELSTVAQLSRTTKEQEEWIKETQYSKAHLKDIFGRFNIEDEDYRVACSCLPANPDSSFNRCYPREIKIEVLGRFPGRPTDPDHPILDVDNLRKLLGAPEDLRMVQVKDQYLSSPDGRSSDEVMGTWGGDAGELFLKVAVWEDLTGTKVLKYQLKKFILLFLRYNKRPYFYMHTDTIALAWVQKEAGLSDWFDPTNPPPALRPMLLKLLTKPEAIGSILFRKIALYPDLFNVRKGMVEMFYECLYEILWDPDEKLNRKIRYYVLHTPGARRESAYVEFDTSPSCQEEGRFPIFPPFSDGISMFVYHPKAIEQHRDLTASFLQSVTGGNLQPERVAEELKTKGKLWREVVEKELEPLAGLPHYRVTILPIQKNEDGEDDIKQR